MKKIFLTPLALALLTLTACDNNDDNNSSDGSTVISSTALPASSQKIIAESFPNETVVLAEKENTVGLDGTLYKTKLSNNFELDFDADGNLTDVDAGLQEVPSDLVPRKIGTYVSTNYPNSIITQIEKEKTTYEVELSDDPDLIFDLEGNFIRIDLDDDEDNKDSATTNSNALPELSKEIIATNFPEATIISVEKKFTPSADGTLYETKLSNNFEIDFDATGNWTDVDGGIQEVPVGLTPEKIKSYVVANYPSAIITQIEKEKTYYNVDLSSNNPDLIFDLQENFIRIDSDSDDDYMIDSNVALPSLSKQIITTNFPNETIIFAEKRYSPSADGTLYETRLSNSFEIDFDATGNWTEVDGQTQAVPSSFIPEKANAYIVQNYPTLIITQIEKEPNSYIIGLSSGTSLVFDLQGNFVRIDD